MVIGLSDDSSRLPTKPVMISSDASARLLTYTKGIHSVLSIRRQRVENLRPIRFQMAALDQFGANHIDC